MGLISLHGTTSWLLIAKYFPGKTVNQCRDRFNLHLASRNNQTDKTPSSTSRTGVAADKDGLPMDAADCIDLS